MTLIRHNFTNQVEFEKELLRPSLFFFCATSIVDTTTVTLLRLPIEGYGIIHLPHKLRLEYVTASDSFERYVEFPILFVPEDDKNASRK